LKAIRDAKEKEEAERKAKEAAKEARKNKGK